MTHRMVEVRVHAGSRSERVVELDIARFEIWTRAIPENGKANEAVLRMLAAHLNVSPSCVTMVRGKTSRHKLFRVAFEV